MEKEIWKEIPGYSGIYLISNTGKVRMLTHLNSKGSICRERILRQKLFKNGYYMVFIRNKYYYVHRLIAMAFIPNPDNKPEIDHINTIRTDNRIENLRWVTHKENCNNTITLKKFGHILTDEEKKHLSEINKGKWIGSKNGHSRKILQYSKDGKLIRQWDSISEAATFIKISHSSIIKCLKKTRKFAKGFKWEYL